jgi:protease-4
VTAAVLAGGIPASARASDLSRFDLLPSSPGVVGGALGGLVNPAGFAVPNGGELAFWWNDVQEPGFQPQRWGLSAGSNFAFAVESNRAASGAPRVYDYQVGLSEGNGAGYLGIAYRWSTGNADLYGHENGVAVGGILRPGRWGSLGATGFWSAESGRRSGVFDLGVRPLGKSWLTLFGDWSLTESQRIDDGAWTAGAEVRAWKALHLGARVRDAAVADELEYSINVGVALDRLGFHGISQQSESGDRLAETWILRFNPPHRGFPLREKLGGAIGPQTFEVVNLENQRLGYDKDLWFDRVRVAWLDLARRLERARLDPTVGGVAVNLAGARIRPSIAWELRRELERFREAGKTVVVHVDRPSNLQYYVASVADRLSMDPQGMITLPGVAIHRTYLKGLLDKLGVGFEEFRYFTYKSANERYSRSDMSEADREQYGRVVDVIYEELRRGISEGRGLTEAEFDAIVDELAILTPAMARERGLVDTVGRWPEVGEWVRKERRAVFGTTPVEPLDLAYEDEQWGPMPILSIVYADGPCEMDSGIRGRATGEYLRRAAKRHDVKAVVLRADSPGGDPLPSDLVAEGLTKVKERGKPVIVSQGDTAASGGYWISMRGDRIHTTPFTMTGSIGVIGGWAWDAGFGEKVGHSADGVQRGAHADLFTGIRFPLGLRLPGRNLDEGEKELARAVTIELYDGFVAAVAQSRALLEPRVRELAEGRVWMGADAVDNGLADETGTLLDAIGDAMERAGLDRGDEFRLEEFPPRERFTLPRFAPDVPGMGALLRHLAADGVSPDPVEGDWALDYVRLVAENPGQPLLLAPPDWLPEEWLRIER